MRHERCLTPDGYGVQREQGWPKPALWAAATRLDGNPLRLTSRCTLLGLLLKRVALFDGFEAAFADEERVRKSFGDVIPLTFFRENRIARVAPCRREGWLAFFGWLIGNVESETKSAMKVLTDECWPLNAVQWALHSTALIWFFSLCFDLDHLVPRCRLTLEFTRGLQTAKPAVARRVRRRATTRLRCSCGWKAVDTGAMPARSDGRRGDRLEAKVANVRPTGPHLSAYKSLELRV